MEKSGVRLFIMALSGHSKLASEYGKAHGKAGKRAPNLLGPRLELLSRGHRPVESGNQTSQNPPEDRYLSLSKYVGHSYELPSSAKLPQHMTQHS